MQSTTALILDHGVVNADTMKKLALEADFNVGLMM